MQEHALKGGKIQERLSQSGHSMNSAKRKFKNSTIRRCDAVTSNREKRIWQLVTREGKKERERDKLAGFVVVIAVLEITAATDRGL